MKAYWNLTPEEKAARDKNNIFKLDNLKYKNITLEAAEKNIKDYWITGIVILVCSIIFYLIMGQIISFVFDAVLMGLMIFGIYKKVRWVGVVFCVYFLIGKLSILFTYPDYINVVSILITLMFLRVFYLGTISLFKWHALKNKPA